MRVPQSSNQEQVYKIKSIIALSITAFLICSCELLGIGGKNMDQKSGGEVVWKVENQEILTLSTQPLISKGNVYFIQDAHLKAYTLKEGKHLWSKQICQLGRTCDYSRTILQDDELLFIDQKYNIQAHSKTTGNIIWETEITDNPEEISGIGLPIMSQDESYLYAGRKGYVVKIRKEDGKEIMRYPLDRLVPEGVPQGSTDPVISPFGDDILYVPTSYFDHSQSFPEEASGGNVFAYDSNSGNLIWERQITTTVPNPYTDTPEDSLMGSPMIYDIEVTENNVIVLAGFYIVALNRSNGEVDWKTYFSEGGFDVGLATTDESAYAASIGTFATKVDLTSGKKQWMQDIRYSNTSIPIVQNERMYFNNSGGGGIWVLNTIDGSVIYNEPPPNHNNDSYDVYISSLGVGEGYMVNVGSKAVYCLKVPK